MLHIKGIGKAKASVLVAAFELVWRGLEQGLGVLPTISSLAAVMALLTEIQSEKGILPLTVSECAQSGNSQRSGINRSLSASIVHPREVFQVAVFHSAASIILAHNHPSGDVSPSKDDIELTGRLVKAGKILGIKVLDHIIIGIAEFLSLQERGLMQK